MKQLARRYCWWPSINADILVATKHCDACQANHDNPHRIYQSWPEPERPWERIHIDYAGPFQGQYWLIVVDVFSKFPYISGMNTITTEATIRALSKIFIIEGLPDTIVSDNGTQFTSQQFQQFCQSHGIEHLTTAPFHPASNGEAERFVRTFKTSMTKICWGGNSTIRALDEFLFAYRTTPNPVSGKSPAELLHGRQPRTQLSLIMPKTKKNSDTHGDKSSKFVVGAPVYVKNFSVRGDSWVHGHIARRLGRMMYSVTLDTNDVVRRHQNQIRPGSILKGQRPDPERYDDFLLNTDIREQVSRAAPHLSVHFPEEDPDEQHVSDAQQNKRSLRKLRRVEIQVPLRQSSRPRHPPKRFNTDQSI
jgi:transposase InsO family protein